MASRRCGNCNEFWPEHHHACPVCKRPCQAHNKSPLPEDEYKWLLYTKAGRIASVPQAETDRVEEEWQALEAEIARRGVDRWSIVDLLEEGWFSVRPAA